MRKLIQELKRRNVLKETIAYLVVAWLILQVFAVVLPIWNAPNWILQVLTITLALGLPLWVAFSWHYQFTASGIRKTNSLSKESKSSKFNRILNATIIIALLAVICLIWINPAMVTVNPTNKLSIAVLPFTNVNDDPESDFLGLALADEITGDLSYIKDINVRPSSSVRKYTKTVIDPTIAGTELKVDFILAGNYLKEGSMIRMDIELVDVNSNDLVWHKDFESDYQSAFQLQDLVSEQVIEGLKVQFSREEGKRRSSDISEDPLAYEYYLRALSQPSNDEGNRLAVNLLNKSIELDSLFAPSWSELGWRTKQVAAYTQGEGYKIEQAEQMIEKALDLNPDLLSALGYMVAIYTETGRIDQSVKTARHALSVNPNNALIYYALSYAYRYAGFLEAAEQQEQLALSLDPINPRLNSMGMTQLYMGNLKEALKRFEQYNDSPYSLAWQGQIHLRMGNEARALKLFTKVIEMDQRGVGNWASIMKYQLEGKPETGRKVLEMLEVNLVDAEQIYNIANLYGLLGFKQDCIRNLRKAVSRGFFSYPVLMNDSFLDSVRNEAGFKEILEEAKTKHETFGRRYF